MHAMLQTALELNALPALCNHAFYMMKHCQLELLQQV